MRRMIKSALISALVIVAVVVAVVGTGCGGNLAESAALAQPGPTDAQGILSQAAINAGTISSGSGDFNVTVTVAGDTAKMPSGVGAFLGQDVTLAGSYAFDDAHNVDAKATLSIAGQTIPLSLLVSGSNAWIQVLGQWYVLPTDMMGTGTAGTSTTGTSISQADINSLMQALTAAGVDPTTWLTGLTVVPGDESINGTATYHVTGTVDVNKIAADVIKLMQDPNIQSLFGDLKGSGTTGTSTSITLPSEQDLQQIQSQLSAMFKNVTVDMWVAKDTYQLRQVQMNANIVPPAGQDNLGINSIGVKATVSINPGTGPVTVTPPADAKPFSDLQQSLGMLQGLFSGAVGGGITGTTTTTVQ